MGISDASRLRISKTSPKVTQLTYIARQDIVVHERRRAPAEIGEGMSKDIRDKRKKVICDLVADSLYVPMKEKELAVFLQVAKTDKEEFHNILEELLAEGKLMFTQKGKYMKGNGKAMVGIFFYPKQSLPITSVKSLLPALQHSE